MTFTELNSVEHYIIHQLSGVNLNSSEKVLGSEAPYGAQWEFRSAQNLKRGVNEVLVESDLKEALIKLNP